MNAYTLGQLPKEDPRRTAFEDLCESFKELLGQVYGAEDADAASPEEIKERIADLELRFKNFLQ